MNNIIENSNLKKAVTGYVDAMGLAEQFYNVQPVYYDKAKIFWLWDFKKFCWENVDETDILNAINETSSANTINSKQKGEILEAMRQVGRKKMPQPMHPKWIQFKDKIYDLKNDKSFDASPKYFTVNPIPWKIAEKEDTPIAKIREKRGM